jgi:hypothetical protein
MNTTVKNWLVIGVAKNWETALSQPVPIWGLKPIYRLEFESLNIGDILWFYATSPIGGVIGLGSVKDKYIDNINLVWPEELATKKVIWPLRFRIHVLKLLPQQLWKTNKIKISDFNLLWQRGFQALAEEHVVKILKRMESNFGLLQPEDIYKGATFMQPAAAVREKQVEYVTIQATPEKLIPSHKELALAIAEIGKLQFYYTEFEYPIDLPSERRNLDVVWKREADGVPTLAFEIELSGMFERAIERLKFAYKKWNSRPRIVIPGESAPKVHNIVNSADRDFRNEIRIYEPTQILDLLGQKRNLKQLEQTLNLY